MIIILKIVSWQDLHAAGLDCRSTAKKRRERLGILLQIGYANGKQFHKRLQTFRITAEEFSEAVERVFEEEE